MDTAFQPDPNVIALGIRQPWVELILRGIKTLEVRSLGTPRRGMIYLYSARKSAESEAANSAVSRHRLDINSLPRGLLVGSVEIIGCRPAVPDDASRACVPAELLEAQFCWELANPRRFPRPLAVRFLPYGVWFYPYRRRNGAER